MQLGFDAFCRLMEDMPEPASKVAVAVSGGADSLALSHCLMDWCTKTGRTLLGVSVDHALRPDSAYECEFVHKFFKSKGFEHVTLQWQGEKPTRSIQESARHARFELMAKQCQALGIRDVFLAHHLDDQAETVLLRLMRGSGVDGLSAIHKIQEMKGLRLFRPFLSLPKSSLIEYLNDYNEKWIEDPSNENMAYDRVRVRKTLKVLNELGLTADRLALSANNMQRARKFLETQQKAWLAREVLLFAQGYVHIRLNPILNDEEEIVLRSLRRVGQSIGGHPQAPRLSRLKNLLNTLHLKQSTTFMGCRWIVEEDHVMVCREARNNLKAHDCETGWDNRLEVAYPGATEGLSMRALGRDGWDQVLRIDPEMKEKTLPFAVILSLFSIWHGQTLLGVPHLNFWTSSGRDLGLEQINVRFNPEIKLFS